MRLPFTFALSLLLLLPAFGYSQQQILIERRVQPKQEDHKDMVFYYFPFKSNILDLTYFKRAVPESRRDIPDKLVVSPPQNIQKENMVYAVSYFQPENSEKGKVIISLVNHYESTQPIYYFDLNQDLDFNNDGPYFIFAPDETFKEVILPNELDINDPLKFRIYNNNFQKDAKVRLPKGVPVYSQPEKDEYDLDDYIQSANELRKKNHLSLTIEGVVGIGSIKYEYTNSVSGYPIWYNVAYNSKGINIQTALNTKYIRIGTFLQFEDLFFYTSQRSERIGEPYIDCSGTECVLKNNIITDTNRDYMPNKILTYGVLVEGDIRIGSMTSLIPFFRLGRYNYLNEVRSYFPERFAAPDEKYPFRSTLSYNMGLMLSADVTTRSSVFVSGRMVFLSFSPENFFEQPGVSDPYSHNRYGGFGLGYRVKFD